jgi:hypothetical protein
MIYAIMMLKKSQLLPALLSLLCLYLLGYAVARIYVFHAVERYAGAEGKGGPRQDYIAKKDRPDGEGWEYHFFLPVIKVEESIFNYFYNLNS